MVADSSGTYTRIIRILSDYLGPASERFLDRQIAFHLEKKPKNLTAQDYAKLTEWIRVSLGLITQDKRMVDEAVARIKKVTPP